MVTLELRGDSSRWSKRVHDQVNGLLVTDQMRWVLDALLAFDPDPVWGGKIAEAQGMSPETVNRILRRLVYAHLIRKDGTRVLGRGRGQSTVNLVRLTEEGAEAARRLTEVRTDPPPAQQPPQDPPQLSRSVARIARELNEAHPEPLTAQGLSKALSVHYNTASGGLKKLVSLGWVQVTEAEDPTQSRLYRYARLTEAGRRGVAEHVVPRSLAESPGN